MSAINVVKQRDRIIVATDTASWNMRGVIMGFWPKCYAVPHMPAVLSFRGPSLAVPTFGWALSGYATFDRMIELIEGEMPVIHQKFGPSLEECGPTNFDLVISGYSTARNAFENYYMTTFDPSERGCTPDEIAQLIAAGAHFPEKYELEKIDDAIIVLPHILPAVAADAGLTEPFDGKPQEVVLRELTVVLELQRRSPFMFPGTIERFHAVGGSATAAVVTKTGVEQFTFHRWPDDEVGELIQPSPIDWTARRAAVSQKPDVAQMSRQQRRYLERQQRKKRA